MDKDLIAKCLNQGKLNHEESNDIINAPLTDLLEFIPYYQIRDVRNWALLQKQRNIYESGRGKENVPLSVNDLILITEACGCEVMDSGRDLDYGSYEGKMTKGKLFHLARMAVELYDMIHDEDDLPGWVNDKVTTAEDRINSAKKYIEYKLLRM